MGRRRLPGKALTGALALVGMLAAACGGGGEAADEPTAPGRGAEPSATATATSTPDPLASQPPDAATALSLLETYFAGRQPACTDPLLDRWNAVCAAGDVDGDGADDVAMLIPLGGPGLRSPDPAVVVVRRAAASKLERFPTGRSESDDSATGRAIFAVADRTGDGRPELVYLSKGCTASTCNALVEIQSWDGTAWRDVGPVDGGLANVERVEFSGSGRDTRLVMRGGRLTSMGAGPSRARTVTYAFDGTRFSVAEVKQDPAEYLYHAILDADALFDDALRAHGRFDAAIAAYRAAIGNPLLKDWKFESEGTDGRAQLSGYALFRIALAEAADNKDPNAALDAVITGSKDEIFQKAAVAFRSGYQTGGTPQAGCLAVTNFLAAGDVPRLIAEMFDYGTANPVKKIQDICPL